MPALLCREEFVIKDDEVRIILVVEPFCWLSDVSDAFIVAVFPSRYETYWLVVSQHTWCGY